MFDDNEHDNDERKEERLNGKVKILSKLRAYMGHKCL